MVMKTGNFTASDFLPVDGSAASQCARMGRVQRFAPHTQVLTEGEFSDGVYVILQGRVKTFVSEPDGGEIVLAILGSGRRIAGHGEPRIQGAACWWLHRDRPQDHHAAQAISAALVTRRHQVAVFFAEYSAFAMLNCA